MMVQRPRVVLLVCLLLASTTRAAGAAAACTELEPAPPGDLWCGASHNQGEYTSDDGATLVGLGLIDSGNPRKFALRASGWRLCGASLEQCHQACVALGECGEMSVLPSGCELSGPRIPEFAL